MYVCMYVCMYVSDFGKALLFGSIKQEAEVKINKEQSRLKLTVAKNTKIFVKIFQKKFKKKIKESRKEWK